MSYTASRHSTTATQIKKHDPFKIFPAHAAKTGCSKAFCGYYWHSRRLAKKGTDWIYDEGKKMFQSKAKNNKVEWGEVREMLFSLKKMIDQSYRNMLWHFGKSECEKCNYWDEVYLKAIANVTNDSSQEIDDEEMLQAAMEVDGSNE